MSLAHSVWTLDVPAGWVDSVPGLGDVLDRRLPVSELGADGRELGGFLTLLREQGCLTYPDRESYALREVKELFQHLSAAWYGRYYSHPLWDRLRAGSLSRNGLVTWLLYNYHLSRSAAMSASRSAVRLGTSGLRRVFAESALEEYSHCEDHFFPSHPSLPLTDGEVRRAVPLPASVAFDQQMLRMAEDDWLGHVLAGFFQESTARFYDECRRFWAVVAERYGLPGFFRNWERHCQIDLDQSHADDFGRVLESDERRAREDVLFSLGNAWLTFRCLLAGLDEVVASDRDDDLVLLRRPVEDGCLDPERSALLEPYRHGLAKPTWIDAPTAGTTWDALEGLGFASLPTPSGEAPPPEDVEFLRNDLACSIFRCSSHSTEHDEILLLGRLAEVAVAAAPNGVWPVERRTLPRSHEAMAIANFLRELATRPTEFAYLLRHAGVLARRLGPADGVPLNHRGAEALARFLEEQEVERAGRDRLADLTLRFNELYAAWLERGSSTETFDFFRD